MRPALRQILLSTSLLKRATRQLGGIAPYHYWDFINNRALFASADVGAVSATPGWSFTRASTGYAETVAGTLTSFASGALRRTDRGVLIEGARTNLFLNSAVGATQSVTVAATAYTLSFRGTGTITLTGTSTAGPLVGTGANNRVTLTFTPTAGSLTLTVSGSCTNVNLEAGSFASSWIETAGASATRAADVLTVSSPGVSYPLTLFAEFERVLDTGGNEWLLQIDAGTDNDRLSCYVTTADLGAGLAYSGGPLQGAETVAGAIGIGTPAKIAFRTATNDFRGARGGVLSTADTVVTVPATPTTIRFARDTPGTVSCWGYLRRAAIINSAVNDAGLQSMTSS